MPKKLPDWLISEDVNFAPAREKFKSELEAITQDLARAKASGFASRSAVSDLLNSIRQASQAGAPYILIREASSLKEKILKEIIECQGIPEAWPITTD